MKLLLTGLITLSIVGFTHAGGIGSGIGFGIGLAIANKVLSGGQERPRERVVEHHTVVHERTVVREKAAPAPSPTNTTVIVNNNIPAQPAAQPNSVTTINAKTIAVTNPPAQVTAPAPVTPTLTAPVQKSLADDTTVN